MAARVGFVGLGEMGLPMALRLIEAGTPVSVFDLRPDRVAECVARGGTAAGGPADASRGASVVILMLPSEDAVWSAARGNDGVLTAMDPDALIVQMSTVSPRLVTSLAALASARGVRLLDAPVARGARSAAQGELLVLVGGRPEDLELARPVLRLLASTVLHVGPLGVASAAKLVNNLVVSAALGALAEGLSLGVRAGVPLGALVRVLEEGSADSWVLRNLVPMALRGRYRTGSKVDIMLKDTTLAAELAKEVGIPLSVTRSARDLLVHANELGFGLDDSTSVLRVLEQVAGVSLRIDDETAQSGQEVATS